MSYTHIAGYKFFNLTKVHEYQRLLQDQCVELRLKGTILLSNEGININLAGEDSKINDFQNSIQTFTDLAKLNFHKTYSDIQPYQRLKVKIKPEIISFREDKLNQCLKRAPNLTPQQLCEQLDRGDPITLVDTRNDYEVRFGSFNNALNLQLKNFTDFKQAAERLNPEATIVMFCTGGIRCEKAALLLMENGFKSVYQLDGGILQYFKDVGGKHYHGECFVFDERVALDTNLTSTGTQQCKLCQGPIKRDVNYCERCLS